MFDNKQKSIAYDDMSIYYDPNAPGIFKQKKPKYRFKNTQNSMMYMRLKYLNGYRLGHAIDPIKMNNFSTKNSLSSLKDFYFPHIIDKNKCIFSSEGDHI